MKDMLFRVKRMKIYVLVYCCFFFGIYVFVFFILIEKNWFFLNSYNSGKVKLILLKLLIYK